MISLPLITHPPSFASLITIKPFVQQLSYACGLLHLIIDLRFPIKNDGIFDLARQDRHAITCKTDLVPLLSITDVLAASFDR